jgi:hypothetical protein
LRYLYTVSQFHVKIDICRVSGVIEQEIRILDILCLSYFFDYWNIIYNLPSNCIDLTKDYGKHVALLNWFEY